MKITVLMENTPLSPSFRCEHGLSLYIESEGRTLLFDMGQSTRFIENAERLGCDLSKVDLAVLSHGHYDHSDGLTAFLEKNGKAPVYLSRYATEKHFSGKRDISVTLDVERWRERLCFVEDDRTLADGISLMTMPPLSARDIPGADGLAVLENGRLVPEDFRHEIYLTVEEKGKRVLFSGCAHRGVVNIAAYFRPDVMIGGFHTQSLSVEKDRSVLKAMAARLYALPTVYYTGHCTGEAPYAFFAEIMGERLCPMPGGSVIEL